MGKIVSKVTGALGLTADPNAGSGARDAAAASMQEVLKRLDAVDLPDIEKQKLILEAPELLELLSPEQMSDSEFQNIKTNPELLSTQMEALGQMKEMTEAGFAPEDMAKFRSMQRDSGSAEQARQKSILADMAARGAGGSGMELAARLQSSQGSANRAAESGDRLAIAAADARRAALSQAGQMAGNIRGQAFGEQAQKAGAQDAIAQFNTMQRSQANQRNVAERQRMGEQRVALANQQQTYNKGLQQQQFQNKMAKAGAAGGALSNMAQQQMGSAAAQAQGAQAQAAGNRALATSAATAMSDERVKENISEANPSKLKDMMDKLTAYNYDYKDEVGGEEDQMGVMAQDLEKSELGKEFVNETPEGIKTVDYGKMGSTLAAAVAQLNERLDKLEGGSGEDFADGGAKNFDKKIYNRDQGKYVEGRVGKAKREVSSSETRNVNLEQNRKELKKAQKEHIKFLNKMIMDAETEKEAEKYEAIKKKKLSSFEDGGLGNSDFGDFQGLEQEREAVELADKFGGDRQAQAQFGQRRTTDRANKMFAASPLKAGIDSGIDSIKGLFSSDEEPSEKPSIEEEVAGEVKNTKPNSFRPAPEAIIPQVNPAMQLADIAALSRMPAGGIRAEDGAIKGELGEQQRPDVLEAGKEAPRPSAQDLGAIIDAAIKQKEAEGANFNEGGLGEHDCEELGESGKRVDESLEDGTIEANPEAQEEFMDVLRGNIDPTEMKEGRVIEGDNFSGDELPDRINSGESVNTVAMQHRGKQMADELAGLKKLLQMLGKKKK